MSRILQVQNLHITFPIRGKERPAVDGLDFHLDQGEILGLVGESGCGKTVTALSLLRLIEPPGRIAEGQAFYFGNIPGVERLVVPKPIAPAHALPSLPSEESEEDETPYEGLQEKHRELTASLITREMPPEGGIDLFQLSDTQMREVRGHKIAMIFQEPMTSLNPVFTIEDQIMEAVLLHQKVGKKQAREIALEMLHKVRIPDPRQRLKDYPHQLSGGMRQRVMIAMALSCQPDILIADEPTTALDVTIQAQILELIQELVQEMHMAVILITHDLGIVAQVCDRVVVMYSGMKVEESPVRRLFRMPKHPYTLGLLQSIPELFGKDRERLATIGGMVPDLSRLPPGCRFADRCPRAVAACTECVPGLKYVGEGQDVRCINY